MEYQTLLLDDDIEQKVIQLKNPIQKSMVSD